jgi:hypothetical protein
MSRHAVKRDGSFARIGLVVLASVALLIIENGLRRRSAQFKLCAHFLDLRCLLSRLPQGLELPLSTPALCDAL